MSQLPCSDLHYHHLLPCTHHSISQQLAHDILSAAESGTPQTAQEVFKNRSAPSFSFKFNLARVPSFNSFICKLQRRLLQMCKFTSQTMSPTLPICRMAGRPWPADKVGFKDSVVQSAAEQAAQRSQPCERTAAVLRQLPKRTPTHQTGPQTVKVYAKPWSFLLTPV